MYIVRKKARGHANNATWRLVMGQPHELPQLIWRLREQQTSGLRHVGHHEQPRRQIPLLDADAGAD